ncbi:MAG: amino acid adenylation domain-containing protein, partial [Acidobacteria bacterium]|nr:amino acid adenylation domain-containing protein [Acidobacteriota bacterium]
FVIASNEMLRTVFHWEGLENPVQLVLKEHHLRPQYYDFSNQNKEMIKKSLENLKVDDRHTAFDLTDVPFRVYLCKTGSATYEMIVSYHHILFDGWSNAIILEEFLNAYHDLCSGKVLQIPAKTRFKAFVTWVKQVDRDPEETFWRNYLYGFETPTELSLKKRYQGSKRTVANFQTGFAKSTKDQIEEFVKTHKITTASLFYSCWGILLQRYNNSDDVVFGTTVSGRPSVIPGIERMVGLFINTIPLRIQSYPGEKAVDFLEKITAALKEREIFENTPLVEIKKQSVIGYEDVVEELFDSIVVIENYPMNSRWSQEKNELIVNSYSMFESTHYDLTLGIELFDDIEINFSYREQVFVEADIERLAGHFTRIMKDIISNPGKEVSRIEMLSAREKHQLLFEWNKTEKWYPQDKTIAGLFVEQALKTPDHIAVIGSSVEGAAALRATSLLQQITYCQLNQQSDVLAQRLIEKGVLADTIVTIMTERSLETITGIMGILKSGGAYLPIDPGYPQERIDYMIKDSGTKLVITSDKEDETLGSWEGEKIILGSIIDPSDHLSYHHSSFIIHHSKLYLNLAYIIYTSGTTGRPKGVAVEHRAAVNTLLSRKSEYNMTAQHTSLQLFSYAFDGFITSFFTPLFSGSRVVLPGENGVKDIQHIKSAIVRHHVTHFICVPPLYQAIIENLAPKEASCLQVVTLAGDALSPGLLEISRQKNPGLEIVNEYGITEAAVMSTIYRHQEKAGRIVIGHPTWNTQIYIMDQKSRLMPMGTPGELCIGGFGLARGYLNNPELTSERFYRSNRTHRTYIFYKTGDLARWLPVVPPAGGATGGVIEFLGRIDHQVKIRGYRVEPGEIEKLLLNHKKIKEAVVLAKDYKNTAETANDNKYLCAYIIGGPSLTETGLREFLAKDLPGYMIPAYFVFLEKIPLTANDKIDRKALPDPVIIDTALPGEGLHVPPRNEYERKLVEIWSAVLGGPPAGRHGIGIDDNFFKLGGHSIKAAKLVLKIHKELQIKVPVNALFENPNIRGLANYIHQAGKEKYDPILPAEEREYYPLTPGQKQFYITRHAGHDDTVYNVQNLVQLDGNLSHQAQKRLENTFRELIHRHESLRTSFELIANEPVQRIHKEVEFKLKYFDLAAKNAKDREEEKIHHSSFIIHHFICTFDLEKAPLMRVGLIKIEEETHILMIDMHHIIADGLSMGLLVKEFTDLYRGEESPPLQIRYRDFAMWQTGSMQNPKVQANLKRQETYWLNELSGELPLLNLPLDFPRPDIRRGEGSSVRFELDIEISNLLKKLAAGEGVTFYILFLAIFILLLSRLCDQEDILVGTPIAGRGHPDLDMVIGIFATMLVIRCKAGAQKNFRDFLREVKTKTLDAHENQDYTYEQLVDKLSIRNPGRNALFDVVFVWEDLELDLGELTFPGHGKENERLQLNLLNYEKISAPFDLILSGTETRQKMCFFINYSIALFKRETIEKIAVDFTALISEILKNPVIKLGEIEMAHELLEASPQADEEDPGDFGF